MSNLRYHTALSELKVLVYFDSMNQSADSSVWLHSIFAHYYEVNSGRDRNPSVNSVFRQKQCPFLFFVPPWWVYFFFVFSPQVVASGVTGSRRSISALHILTIGINADGCSLRLLGT